MKKISFLLLLFISMLTQAQTRMEKDYYELTKELKTIKTFTNVGGGREKVEIVEYTGTPSKELWLVNYETHDGKIEGRENYYSTREFLLYYTTYSKGIPHGPSKKYHPNGKIENEYNYVNGKIEGLSKSYYINGQPLSVGNYVNGEQEGEWKHYHKNGQLNATGIYKNGKRESIWRGYFEDGSLYYVKNYIKGEVDPNFKTTEVVSAPCPNPKKIIGISMLIASKEKVANAQGRFVWKYQYKLMEAACADPLKDSEEEIGRKIAAMMKQFEDKLICNNTKFDVANGNVIKFAANLLFDEFIIDMCYWKVNFNKVDETDGRTVLDYVKDLVERNKGLPAESTHKRYYDMIRKAGGKHKFEF